MNMTLNEVIVKHNFISKILLKSEDAQLSKELKAKIMSMRIDLNRLRTRFEEDAKEVIEHLKPEGYDELGMKQEKTAEETELFNSQTAKLNEEYEAFIAERNKEGFIFEKTIKEDEYYEIVEVNSGNDVDINGAKIPAPDFLEVIYSLFVE